MKRGLLVAVFLIAAVRSHAQPRPSFIVLQPGNVVAAALPASILHTATVRKQLASGLTTTFVVAARQREGVTGARIEIRYDLWDEVWHVRKIEFDRREDHQKLTSMEALEKWWRAPVRIFTTSDESVPLQVELTVLPFSASEEEDARQWIAKGGGATRPSGDGLVDALIGTTLSAKPIVRWKWHVQVNLK